MNEVNPLKTKVEPYGIALLFLFVVILLFSFLSSILYTMNGISTQTYGLLNQIGAYTAFSISGLAFGWKVTKKALLHALFMTVVLLLLSFFIRDPAPASWLHLIAHCLLWFICAMAMRAVKTR